MSDRVRYGEGDQTRAVRTACDCGREFRLIQQGELVVREDCLVAEAIARMGPNEVKWPSWLPKLQPGQVAEWVTPVGTFLVHVKASPRA